MKKETSSINSTVILDYLKSKEIDYNEMIKDLDPMIDAFDDPENFLRDPNNWISTGVVTKLFERATRLLDDENAAYNMGRYATENRNLGFAQQIIVKTFWSIKSALLHSQKINDQFNKSKKVELVEIKRNEATVRLHWNPEMETSKHICQYNQGIYTSIPLIWGGSRLTFKEQCCYFDGAPYCEYHLKWPLRNRLREIISRFFTSQSVLMDTVREMEKDKNLINQKNEELKSINEKLQIEIDQHKHAEEALRESEEKYRLLTENVSDVIWTMDMDLNYTYISPAIEKMQGWNAEEAASLEINDVLTPQSIEIILKRMDAHMVHGDKTGNYNISDRFELELYCKDGTTIWSEISASALLDGDSKPVGILGITRDITERKKLEIQLQRAQKMEAIGTMTGGIAHDFNNLLGVILGNTELAQEGIEPIHHTHKHLDAVKKASLQAVKIISQLLTFSRMSDKGLEVIDIMPVINEALNFLQSSIPSTVQIQQQVERCLLPVVADPTQINQIIMNLCINAYHSMENSKGVIDVNAQIVDISSEEVNKNKDLKPGRQVEIIISDNGSGIPPKIIDRIFDPYFTTKEVGKGSGMGLSVVVGIIKTHKGVILVDSELGKGSRFSIYLPLASTSPAPKERSEPEEHFYGRGTVLFVDDDKAIGEMFSEMITRIGYQVKIFTNPLEALIAFKSKPGHFDLVITDMTMPKMTGADLTEKLKAIRDDIPIIICTGHSDLMDEQKASTIGIAAFIMKPFLLKEISHTIGRVMDKYYSRRPD